MEIRQIHHSVAKMMAVENVSVVHDKYAKTAAFDFLKRQLILPMWNNVDDSVYTLLIAHEVGHALYTPNYFTDIKVEEKYENAEFRQIINIVEDARIEKLILTKFPGVKPNFYSGYKDLLKINLFGDYKKRLEETPDIFDKINLYFKVGRYTAEKIEVSEKEFEYIQKVDSCVSFDDVLVISKLLFDDFVKEQAKERQRQQQQLLDELKKAAKKLKEQQKKAEPQQAAEKQEPQPESSESEEVEEQEKESDKDNSESEEKSAMTEPESAATEDEDSDQEGDSDSSESGKSDDIEAEKTESASARSFSEALTEESFTDMIEELVREESKPAEAPQQEAKQKTVQEQIDESIQALSNDRSTYDYPIKLTIDKPVLDGIIQKYLLDYKDFIVFLNNIPARDTSKYNEEEIIGLKVETEFAKQRRNKFLSNFKAEINSLCNAFEMKKRATLYRRARIHSTGRIDCNKLHSHKFNENIFKKMTVEPKGKNHGLIFFLDLSGSMRKSLDKIVEQTILLCSFCKRSGIPFEVYGFTQQQVLAGGRYQLYNIFSSRMTKQEFDHVCKNLISAVVEPVMAGTPLNLTIILATRLYDIFKDRHNSEIINFIFLTDGGDNTSFRINGDQVIPSREFENLCNSIFLEDRRVRKTFINKRKTDTSTKFLFRYLKEYTNNHCNII